MPDHENAACANCGTARAGAFCPECGQEQREVRISFGRWLSELLDEFSLNARLPRTLWLLFSRPGFLSAEWSAGRRARYISALRLYILASLVFFSVTFFVGLPIIGELNLGFGDLGTEIGGSAEDLANSVVARRMQGFLTLAAAMSVPLVALWLKRWDQGSERLYVDHLVLSLNVHSLALFVLTPAYVSLFFGLPGYLSAAAMMLFLLGYWAVAWWRTYGLDGRPIRSTAYLAISSAGSGFITIFLLFTVLSLAGVMLGRARDVQSLEIANGTYVAARTAFVAQDFERARHIAEVGVDAYARVDTAALDGHHPFHVAEIHRFAAQHVEAREKAERLIGTSPEDLLAIGLAGVSAESLGDSVAARAHYERLLALVGGGAQSTLGHTATLARYQYSARLFTGQGSPGDLRESAFRAYGAASVSAAEGDSANIRLTAQAALAAYAIDGTALQDHDPFHIAEMFYQLQLYDSAGTRLGELLANDPEDVLSLGLAGASAEAGGDSVTALEFYTRTLDLLSTGTKPITGHQVVFDRVLEAARRFTGREESDGEGR